MLLDVVGKRVKVNAAVLDLAERVVAARAEQRAHTASRVVVVDLEHVRAARNELAQATPARLRDQYHRPVVKRDPVGAPQMLVEPTTRTHRLWRLSIAPTNSLRYVDRITPRVVDSLIPVCHEPTIRAAIATHMI